MEYDCLTLPEINFGNAMPCQKVKQYTSKLNEAQMSNL